MNLRLIEHNRYKKKNIIKNDSNIDYNVFISVINIDHLKLICKRTHLDFDRWENYFNTYYKINNYFKINFIRNKYTSYCHFQCKNCDKFNTNDFMTHCRAQNYKEIFIS